MKIGETISDNIKDSGQCDSCPLFQGKCTAKELSVDINPNYVAEITGVEAVCTTKANELSRITLSA